MQAPANLAGQKLTLLPKAMLSYHRWPVCLQVGVCPSTQNNFSDSQHYGRQNHRYMSATIFSVFSFLCPCDRRDRPTPDKPIFIQYLIKEPGSPPAALLSVDGSRRLLPLLISPDPPGCSSPLSHSLDYSTLRHGVAGLSLSLCVLSPTEQCLEILPNGRRPPGRLSVQFLKGFSFPFQPFRVTIVCPQQQQSMLSLLAAPATHSSWVFRRCRWMLDILLYPLSTSAALRGQMSFYNSYRLLDFHFWLARCCFTNMVVVRFPRFCGVLQVHVFDNMLLLIGPHWGSKCLPLPSASRRRLQSSSLLLFAPGKYLFHLSRATTFKGPAVYRLRHGRCYILDSVLMCFAGQGRNQLYTCIGLSYRAPRMFSCSGLVYASRKEQSTHLKLAGTERYRIGDPL